MIVTTATAEADGDSGSAVLIVPVTTRGSAEPWPITRAGVTVSAATRSATTMSTCGLCHSIPDRIATSVPGAALEDGLPLVQPRASRSRPSLRPALRGTKEGENTRNEAQTKAHPHVLGSP